MHPPKDPKLERFIHRALRELPAPAAPRTLEARVLAEIERRAGLPWWRKNFAHWPLAARAVFLLGALGAVYAAWTFAIAGGSEAAQLQQVFAPQLAWFDAGAAVVRALGDFAGIALRSIPTFWVYGLRADRHRH